MRKPVIVTLFIVVLMLVTFSFIFQCKAESAEESTVDVRVYVVSLDGLSGHGVNNVSSVVAGALSACQVDTVHYCTWEEDRRFYPPPLIYGEFRVNLTVSVVADWETYRNLVESGSNLILLNVHGETVPVPSGYSKEGWVDKIAEAMADRNVTWVHTGGYPFYYSYFQGSGEEEWGEEGFKSLMGHIGKGNVSCNRIPPPSEIEPVNMHEHFRYNFKYEWETDSVRKVELGHPLNFSDFKENVILTIWGGGEFTTGAVIDFAEPNERFLHGFGAYVHIGTRKTFWLNNTETDGDYYRGYVGAAAAIWTFTLGELCLHAVSNAEAAIAKAESEGRIMGLYQARLLLQQAKESNFYEGTLRDAKKATEAANNATKPNASNTDTLALAIIGVVGMSALTGLAFKWKKNSKR